MAGAAGRLEYNPVRLEQRLGDIDGLAIVKFDRVDSPLGERVEMASRGSFREDPYNPSPGGRLKRSAVP